MNTSVEKILHEVKKVIAGKDDVLEKIMMTVLSRGHVLLDDVPGTGKTTTALAFSRALGLRYGRIQFTPDVLPSDIVGFSMYHKESGSFAYQPGAVMTNLLLADEINRTSSKTQSALLEVMEERQVTVDGQTHKLPDPFVVIATQNPVGSAGTQLLPQAQLDRFMVRLEMGYPDFASQVNILRDRQTGDPLEAVATVSSCAEVLAMQKEAQSVHMADALLEYVTSLAEASRSHPLTVLGVSPRGALAVCRISRSRAYMAGRDYVLPDDVAAVFADVCAHRLILSPKASDRRDHRQRRAGRGGAAGSAARPHLSDGEKFGSFLLYGCCCGWQRGHGAWAIWPAASCWPRCSAPRRSIAAACALRKRLTAQLSAAVSCRKGRNCR
ncbi:MAG: AAA family ATPase [Oscillospiraceae bacterium]